MLTHREKAVRELTLITSGDFFFSANARRDLAVKNSARCKKKGRRKKMWRA